MAAFSAVEGGLVRQPAFMPSLDSAGLSVVQHAQEPYIVSKPKNNDRQPQEIHPAAAEEQQYRRSLPQPLSRRR